MQLVFKMLTIGLLMVGVGLGQEKLTVARTVEVAQTQRAINTIVPISLPVAAMVWTKADGTKTGQVKGFDSKQQILTLGGESIQLSKINKVTFDRKALAYRSDGSIIIRGEDNAKAKQKSWQNVSTSAFRLKDSERGQAQVDLNGVIKPIELRGIQSVAVKSVYVVDEIQFQGAGKMTIRVMPSDR